MKKRSGTTRSQRIKAKLFSETDLGCCYMDGKGTEVDLGKARYWFERAAAKGHEKATNHLKDLNARV
ncbi:hypothetical protein JL722_2326 [Aureococcus anophagefferens]|nr:hypothetical protein JL722_2326 [Aureococcus anophagefferens]